uniref:Protein piccolo n=2 Tax=Lygus hesperus TaxID=30085 RepID=A0A0A9W588_LYGHE
MVGEPYVPSFRKLPEEHGRGEIGIIIMFGLDSILFEKIVTEPWNWNTANLTQDLTPEKGDNLSVSYVEGPWDPVFQLYWAKSNQGGCAMTKYKNSDTAAMSKIFHMEINETQELWNIVCVFRPAGCVAGAEAWNQCPETSPTPSTPEPTDPETSNPTPSNPTNPNPTNPNPTPPPPTTRQPQSTGKRIGQRMGFNFESLTILVAAALSRNLVHMLNPSFI